jgi:hypothetical protein
MATNLSEKIEMKTKSGLSFTVSFSNEPPDYKRLAKLFLLLSQNPNPDNRSESQKV